MSMSRDTIIQSEPKHIYRALLHPDTLTKWWHCTAVIEARPGGLWVGGWGEGENGLGHQAVIWAEVARLEPDRLVALKMGEAEIAFEIAPDAQGCKVTVKGTGFAAATPQEEEAALQSWVDAVANLKTWAEEHHKYTPPAPKPQPQPPPAPRPMAPPAPKPQPQASPAPAGAQAAASAGAADPYHAAEAIAKGGVQVLDDGGFGVSDPNGVIKSWSKEQGFGYVTHPQLGDVVFDYDGCDFEPAPGDKVLILVIGKRYDGKPKVKRIACPAKGSNIRA